MLQIYYGDGKGKTTACVGLSVRAAGEGIPVLFTQFLKDGTSNELDVLKNIDNITVYDNYCFEGFIFQKSDSEKREVSIQYEKSIKDIEAWINNLPTTTKVVSALVVMDEVMHCINMGLLDEKSMMQFFEDYKDKVEFVLSGGEPSENMREIADYITCVKKDKHPFDKGVASRKGIEN